VSALLTAGTVAGAVHSLLLVRGRRLTVRISAGERRLLLLAAIILAAANWLYLFRRGA
jgi:hypothetical protein